MRVGVFSTKPYDRQFLLEANEKWGHELSFYEARLVRETASLAADFPAVCTFVNDRLDAGVLLTLARGETRLIALRSAGFNNVDLQAAAELDLKLVRVPAYSPEAVAEHTVGLIMALNRKIHRAYARVREGNFSLDGLLGFNLHEQTVGIIGGGKIGQHVARILRGCDCRVLVSDPVQNPVLTALDVTYVNLMELLEKSDIITLHCPLMAETRHLIDSETLSRMKRGVMLINTSRGGLVDTQAVVGALKSGRVGALGLDVYEEEGDFFFEDYSELIIKDDVLARLLTFPNVLITSHQGFFTRTALRNICEITLENIGRFEQNGECRTEVAWTG